MLDVTKANAEFWNEPCGTALARSIGIEQITGDSLARYDEAYFRFYPYLTTLVEQVGIGGATVLEIGLGFGTVGQYIAQRAATYHGIDIAEEPVGLLQQRMSIIDRAASSDIRQGSALALPYPSESFDSVISIGTCTIRATSLPRSRKCIASCVPVVGHSSWSTTATRSDD